jgi:putative iron-regulated protein
LEVRLVYGQTEGFRFYGGPIDDDRGIEGRINPWPLDENYIDYVKDNDKAGIINDTTNFPTIDKKTLIDLNEKDGEKNISLGFHAIEFLLWGQDMKSDSAGERPHTD